MKITDHSPPWKVNQQTKERETKRQKNLGKTITNIQHLPNIMQILGQEKQIYPNVKEAGFSRYSFKYIFVHIPGQGRCSIPHIIGSLAALSHRHHQQGSQVLRGCACSELPKWIQRCPIRAGYCLYLISQAMAIKLC